MHAPEMKRTELRMLRSVMGNDAFAAQLSAVQAARAMFANRGIDLQTVEVFWCRVTRNHEFDDVQGGDVLPMWDMHAEIEYTAPADESKDSE